MKEKTAIERLEKLGITAPSVLLPSPQVDITKWPVVACDQFTSEPAYWEKVAENVGDAPSTLHMIFPELYLEAGGKAERIAKINQTMKDYLDQGIMAEQEPGFVLVERTFEKGGSRWGLMAALDLEAYDFSKGSTSLVRATEGTVMERIPPRVEIRGQAPIEFPHILVLIDDPKNETLGPIQNSVADLPLLYDISLMQGGGRIKGYKVGSEAWDGIADALEHLLADAEKKVQGDEAPILFAMGDGNHSLATAKTCWEQLKAEGAGMDHPARYALVELNDIFGIDFEPIHRVAFGSQAAPILEEIKKLGTIVKETEFDSYKESYKYICSPAPEGVQRIAFIEGARNWAIDVENSSEMLTVGTLQVALDSMKGLNIDYIHGEPNTYELATAGDNVGILLPPMGADQLFPFVMKYGALPRKTFSMGDAEEKRYYLEGRRIR